MAAVCGSHLRQMMVSLIEFEKVHYKFIENEITDSKFLMQWAGPKYTYPLSWEQMEDKIKEQDENGKKNFLFSAAIRNSLEIIGHVQLTVIDHTTKIANIGSVLILSKFRNMGLGTEIMKAIMNFGFNQKGMNELRLGVFDFNMPAIQCYKKAGFAEYKFEENAIEIDGEKWNHIRMKINREMFKSLEERWL